MAFITNPQHNITLGGLPLVAAGKPVSNAAGFTTDVSSNGTTWGNPSVVVSTLISQLSDGDIVNQDRVGNREPVLYVRISAETFAGLIAGDSALSAVVGGPCELVWTPPGAGSPDSVVKVVHSKMDHQWDDFEALRYNRIWVITMSALPWIYSAATITTPAVTATAPTVLDAGGSTTGWSAPSPSGAALSTASGSVINTYNPALGSGGLGGASLVKTATFSTTTSKYIGIDWLSSQASSPLFSVNNGPFLTEIRREPAPTATYTRSWYKVADATSSVTLFNFAVTHGLSSGSATLRIDQAILANELPSTGSARQQSRTIYPGGNVPGEGNVLVQAPTTGLGQAVVFSHPARGGYSPPLRPWRVSSSAVTTDSGFVSGAWNALDTITEFRVPNASIPEGATQLWIRAGCNAITSVNLFWAIYPAIGSTLVGGLVLSGTTTLTFASTFTYQMFAIAAVPLPVAKSGAAGLTRIEIQAGNATSPIVYLDEAWLFATDRGRLTVVDCGTGTPAAGGTSNRLKVGAPSLSDPNGSILIGTAADWSDAYAPGASRVVCDQVGHRFSPQGSVVFTVTPGATDAAVSFEHQRRWRAEAGD